MYIGFIVFFSFLGLAHYCVLMAEHRVSTAAVRIGNGGGWRMREKELERTMESMNAL
jgi:hypothetical protein